MSVYRRCSARPACRILREMETGVFRSLRHRNYKLFLSGQLISVIGMWMQSVAQAWLVYRLTGSAALLGWVGFAGQLPLFVLSPLGGALADRFDRRRIVILTQSSAMVLAFVLAALTFAGMIQVWHIVVLATLTGITNTFDVPARQSFLLDMVGREDLPNAIALNSSMFHGSRMVGPAIAGLMVASVGEAWCFLLNAVTYLAVLIGLWRMQVDPRPHIHSSRFGLSSMAEGFYFVARTKPVLAILTLLGTVVLVGSPYAVLMPVFASEVFHGGAKELGVLTAAAGLGALTAALLLAGRTSFKGLGRIIAAASIAFGLLILGFALSTRYELSLLLLLAAGFFQMLQITASNTLIQAMIPNELRGRVMAVYSMVFLGLAPFGALLAGSLAQAWTAPRTVLIGGVLTSLAGALFAIALPSIRAEARERIRAVTTLAE